MKKYTIFVWQPYICPHITPWVEGLLLDPRVKEVFYIIPHIMDDNRKNFNWDGNSFIDSNKIELIISPNNDKLNKLYNTDISNAIHIYHGMVCFKFMDYYFKYGLNYNIRRFITTEPPYIFQNPLWLHYIKFYIRDYKYAKYIERVFAIGGSLCEDFYTRVYHWKVTPFIYTTKKPENNELPIEKRKDTFLKLVYVGNISKRKNVQIIIDAIKDKKISNNIVLDIIGDGEKRSSIESAIKINKMENKVHLVGNQNLHTIYNSLKNYDAIILPSLHDGWGAVINEGLMRGCYAIVSNHCGAKALITNKKLGCIFSIEKKNLKDYLINCIENIDKIRATSHYRINWSRNISGDIVAQYLLNAIENKTQDIPWLNNEPI